MPVPTGHCCAIAQRGRAMPTRKFVDWPCLGISIVETPSLPRSTVKLQVAGPDAYAWRFLFKMDDGAHVARYPATLSSNTFLCTSYLRNSKVRATNSGGKLPQNHAQLDWSCTKSGTTGWGWIRAVRLRTSLVQRSMKMRAGVERQGSLTAQGDHSRGWNNCTEGGVHNAFE
jgi:hypothetical protein